MKSRVAILQTRWLPALLLAAVLGAQVVQAAHIHADHQQGPDCVQCKLESGHAVVCEPANGISVAPVAATVGVPVPAGPVSKYFRLPSRGPPTLST